MIINLAFLISLVSGIGSLIFSEILNYPPCVLCWYQRICMYPLVIIYFISIWTQDHNAAKYRIVFIMLGLSIASYHNLLYYEWIPNSITPCTQGISCTSKHIEWFGFITIPFLSFMAFSSLLTLELLNKRKAL